MRSTPVAGTLTYAPASGAVLPVRTQTLSTTLTPTDTNDYNSAASTVALTVTDATPTISLTSSPNPSMYGQPVTFSPTWPANATGTMSFHDGTTLLGTAVEYPISTPAKPAFNPTTGLLYITNCQSSGFVTVLNATSNTPVASIAVGSYPYGVAVNATTNTIYVANYESDTVSVINGATNAVTATIGLGSAGPWQVAVNSTTNTVYISSVDQGSIVVINGATNTITSTITLQLLPADYPYALAVNETTNTIYTAISDLGTNELVVISGATNRVTTTVTVGYYPSIRHRHKRN
jgi:YVTN family beta-propeller protein